MGAGPFTDNYRLIVSFLADRIIKELKEVYSNMEEPCGLRESVIIKTSVGIHARSTTAGLNYVFTVKSDI